jgi:hypothetical protein
VADRKAGQRLQDGQLKYAALADGRLHEREALSLELPCRAELHDHPRGWNAGALLPHVHGELRLGRCRHHKFDTKQLDHQKESCQTHCFSTLNHILGWCYNDQRVIKYFFKQLAHGFQGMKGQM